MFKKLITIFILNFFVFAIAGETSELYEESFSSFEKIEITDIQSSTQVLSTECENCEDDCHDSDNHCQEHCNGLHHILKSSNVVDIKLNFNSLRKSRWNYKFLYGPPSLSKEIIPPLHS